MKRFRSLFLFSGIFILLWWGATLAPPIKTSESLKKKTLTSFWDPSEQKLKELSPLKRKTLKKALQGDVNSLFYLLENFKNDAALLKKEGYLPFDLKEEAYLEIENIKLNNPSLSSLQEQPLKLLPQTYASATFLLSLVNPEEIIAIPKGLRLDKTLFPPHLLEKIPLDIDRHQSEKLFLKHPDIAFVATYSDPSMIEALQAQGIPLFYFDCINSFDEIANSLLEISKIVQKKDKGKILYYLMYSTYCNILNRYLLLGNNQDSAKQENAKSVLFLKYYQFLSVPTKKSLNTQLIDMLHYKNSASSKIEKNGALWNVPFSLEEIVSINPDIIFFISPTEGIKQELVENPSLQQIQAIKKGTFFCLDEALQNSPTQFIVLALYDLSLLELRSDPSP